MDSISLERERGITIASKVRDIISIIQGFQSNRIDRFAFENANDLWLVFQVTSITWKENELNMVDTPGHADFGGEVRLSAEYCPN